MLYNCILLAWSMCITRLKDLILSSKGSLAYNPIYFSSLFLMPKVKDIRKIVPCARSN